MTTTPNCPLWCCAAHEIAEPHRASIRVSPTVAVVMTAQDDEDDLRFTVIGWPEMTITDKHFVVGAISVLMHQAA